LYVFWLMFWSIKSYCDYTFSDCKLCDGLCFVTIHSVTFDVLWHFRFVIWRCVAAPLSDTKLVRYQANLVTNLSDTKLIKYKTYLRLNLSDTKLSASDTDTEGCLWQHWILNEWCQQRGHSIIHKIENNLFSDVNNTATFD
jgi:hypothetical protein